ncbi:hypothetical protein Lesp02_10240 [Lentzea sp. NBRC 105346]|uniref:hypothetical protein n=1 Tax=Lentzea sp. NBRC 105346 TaxID=3032205 RepID=UPI0024A11781|nr:hypothetical protein [Lentzea sp. NBRC 105346]GLZ28834.1 hypothetical protein Lesp02_10240 [Lentzea sp. NBRC 105346]
MTVTSPRTRAPRARRPYSGTREINEQSELGAVYMRTLIRAQRRLGLFVCLIACGSLMTLPLLFTFTDVGRVKVMGLGLPWFLLCVLVFPMLLLAGWFYVRQAERSEREFAELVERP